MGCAGSKLDDLQAVALCRGRSQHLADAIRLRYELADAHATYLHSLRAVGNALDHLFGGPDLLSPPSPVLPLPTKRKGDPMPPPVSPPRAAAAAAAISSSAAPGHHHSSSNSGSHLKFHSSDSEYSDSDDGPLHSDHSSPLPHMETSGMEYMMGHGGPVTYMNYAKKGAAPAVSFEQPAMNPEVVQVEEHSYYGYPYATQNTNYNSNPYPYPPPYTAYGGGMGGLLGGSMPPPSASPSSSEPPPLLPSPPRVSTWDFLNLFESVPDSYYPSYMPSRSSKEVREEEGIPDLEEEEYVVIKEAYGDQKFVVAASSSVNAVVYSSSKAAAASAVHESGRRSIGEQPHYQARSSGTGEDGGRPDYEMNLVEKNVVTNEMQKRQPEEVVKRKAAPQWQTASEVVQEIKDLFHRASESCNLVSNMLEVGKQPYHQKNYQVVSSKMMSTIVPPISLSMPATSDENGGSPFLGFNEEKVTKSGNLSLTLQKLYIWEKKLYEEVRAEEKLRILHDRKCKQLKHLDEWGAEAPKVDSTQALVRKLSTKIRITIQVVDSISNKICMLRDEELWPQINELIQGFVKMWRAMMECHRSQCQAITESTNLDSIAHNGKFSDGHLEAMKQLELSLLNWIDAFCAWFNAQRSFVKALNGWFLKCILYEPEVTADGVAPFSPGRLGAPPVFVICNQWSQAMDSASDREVVAAMQAFAASLLQLWDQWRLVEHQKMMANRDMDRRLKVQEREEQMVHKAVDVLNKKLFSVSDPNGIPMYGQMVHVHSLETSSLQGGLKEVFDAMERFADASVRIYERLVVRSEEERVARENGKFHRLLCSVSLDLNHQL